MAFPTVDFPVLPGQRAGAGSDTALYLEMFSGEVLKRFREKNIMMDKHRVISVGPGDSFQWPAIGKTDTAYHVRGENVLDGASYLTQIEHLDRAISVDKSLLSSIFVDNWDERIRHFETRSEYAYQQGAALAKKMDQQLFQLLAVTARAAVEWTDPLNTDAVGLQVAVANSSTDMTVLIDSMVTAATNFAEKDVPMEEVWFAVRPQQFFELQQSGELLNIDYGNTGNGSQAGGTLLKGYGFNIVWSNNIPSADLSAVTEDGERNTYNADFRETVALAWHRDAIGTVMRDNIMTESDYRLERQGHLVISKVLTGHGALKPECCVEITDTAIVP